MLRIVDVRCRHTKVKSVSARCHLQAATETGVIASHPALTFSEAVAVAVAAVAAAAAVAASGVQDAFGLDVRSLLCGLLDPLIEDKRAPSFRSEHACSHDLLLWRKARPL